MNWLRSTNPEDCAKTKAPPSRARLALKVLPETVGVELVANNAPPAGATSLPLNEKTLFVTTAAEASR